VNGQNDAGDRYLAGLIPALSDEDFHLEDPPDGLFDRIVAGLDEAGPATVPAPADVPSLGDRRAGVERGRNWMPLMVAAAVFAVLVVAGVVVRLAAPSAPEIAGRALLTSDGLPNRNDLIGQAQLVRVDGKQEIDLDVPDLPEAAGSYFELWLLAPDGTRLQSLGVTDGHGRYLVPTGIDPHGYPLVDVSREPPDGNPAHSGDSLVRGRLDI
jgi:hypothetical protein